jgi:hypothetical protein
VPSYPDQFTPWRPGWIVFGPDRVSLCYAVPITLQVAVAASTADSLIYRAENYPRKL